MIGHDENQEEVSFKVADRRKFNSDGSVKEGVTLESAKAEEKPDTVPHPATGKRTLDLETGKYWLDVLGMLRDKTKDNLHPQEARLLDGLLGDLRMQYVQLVRATEEKLKAQAAAKFSGDDILGKK